MIIMTIPMPTIMSQFFLKNVEAFVDARACVIFVTASGGWGSRTTCWGGSGVEGSGDKNGAAAAAAAAAGDCAKLEPPAVSACTCGGGRMASSACPNWCVRLVIFYYVLHWFLQPLNEPYAVFLKIPVIMLLLMCC